MYTINIFYNYKVVNFYLPIFTTYIFFNIIYSNVVVTFELTYSSLSVKAMVQTSPSNDLLFKILNLIIKFFITFKISIIVTQVQ